MQVTLSKNEKIIYDVLINDINVVDAIHIVSQYAALTTIRVNEEKHGDEIKAIMQQKKKEARKPRKRKNSDYADEDDYDMFADRRASSEEALLSADAALLQATRQVSKSYKGSPITKEEFIEAFDQRLEDMRCD
jgi:hypothetical protein